MKNKIITYHKQNKVQKELLSFVEMVKPNREKVKELNLKGIKIYNPKVNKIKMGFVSAVIVGCILTPFTNIAIPYIIKWGLR